jgi:hypothetical protein
LQYCASLKVEPWGLSFRLIRHLSQSDWDGDIIPRWKKHRPRLKSLGSKGGKKMKKQTQEPQQEINNQPQDIGKMNIPNVMLWMLKNAYEQTTIKRVGKELGI